MNNKQKFQTLLSISIYACILFVTLSGLAMYFYPGGSMHNNPSNPNYNSELNTYSHSMNFFSDLGLYHSWSGEPNFLSNILFAYSLLFVGIGIISFYCGIYFLLKKDQHLILISKIGIIVAFISAIGFILVGFTPSDRLLSEHMFVVNLAFRSFLVVMLIYTYSIFRSSYISNYLSFIYFILFCLVSYYVYILMAGPPMPSVSYGQDGFFIPNERDLLFHVVSQKIVIYGLSFSILCQILFLNKKEYIDLID
tara:strand:- start:74 stop:829 length:756 start_codon:yes stop_codon:yes gene_type:complete